MDWTIVHKNDPFIFLSLFYFHAAPKTYNQRFYSPRQLTFPLLLSVITPPSVGSGSRGSRALRFGSRSPRFWAVSLQNVRYVLDDQLEGDCVACTSRNDNIGIFLRRQAEIFESWLHIHRVRVQHGVDIPAMFQCVTQNCDRWMDGRVGGWMGEWVNRWMDGWEWVDEWRDGHRDGWIKGLINRWMVGWYE